MLCHQSVPLTFSNHVQKNVFVYVLAASILTIILHFDLINKMATELTLLTCWQRWHRSHWSIHYRWYLACKNREIWFVTVICLICFCQLFCLYVLSVFCLLWHSDEVIKGEILLKIYQILLSFVEMEWFAKIFHCVWVLVITVFMNRFSCNF